MDNQRYRRNGASALVSQRTSNLNLLLLAVLGTVQWIFVSADCTAEKKGGGEAATGLGATHPRSSRTPMHSHANARLTQKGHLRLVTPGPRSWPQLQ